MSIPNFRADPMACLQAIYNHAPSLEALPHLSGRVASSVKEEGPNLNPDVALLYLKASARHLSAVAIVNQQPSVVAGGGTAASSSTPNTSSSFPLQQLPFGLPPGVSIGADATTADMQQAQHLNEISEALCYAALRCKPRSGIVDSGILPVLAQLLPSKPSNSNNNNNSNNTRIRPEPGLSPLQADILHMFLCAGEAESAQQLVMDEWPRPSRELGVVVVLRYFYLRGMVHLQGRNWEWAILCFWTCLSIPADVTSAFVIGAWKKLVLLQALSQSDRLPVDMTAMKIPKTTPGCVSRFITHAINSAGSGTSGGNVQGSDQPASAGGDNTASLVTAAPEDVTGQASSIFYLSHCSDLAMADETLTAISNSQPNRHDGTDAGVRAYSDLVRHFVKVNKDAFGQALNRNHWQLSRDGNLPLVQSLETELAKRQIYQWGRVVSAIPLKRLSMFVNMPVNELQTLLQTIAKTNPQWPIQVKDQIAYFPKYVPNVTPDYTPQLSKLTTMMQKLDVSISTSSKFLTLVRRDNIHGPDSGKVAVPRGVEDV